MDVIIDDIIVVLPSIFEESFNKSSRDENIDSRYEKLFSTYSCFSNFEIKPKKYNTQYKIIHPKQQHVSVINVNKNQIRGYLNKLNVRNYNTLSKKIIGLCSLQSVSNVIAEILDFCVLQTLYIDTYIKLISDMKMLLDKEVKTVLEDSVIDYINNYINTKGWIHRDNINTSYLQFCDDQKNKNKAKSMNTLLFKVADKVLLQKYINLLVEDFNAQQNTNSGDEFGTCAVILEMLIYAGTYHNFHPTTKLDIKRVSNASRISFLEEKYQKTILIA